MSNETIINRIREKLDGMMGKQLIYGANSHAILKYKIDPMRERVYINTSENEYDRPFDSFFEFITLFKEASPTAIVPKEHEMIVRQVKDEDLVNLRDILMDNIKKIKADKDYIPQAEAIKGNVDSIINLAKTDIAYMTFFKNNKK